MAENTDHPQGQKNVDDTNEAWARFQDFLEVHLPNNTIGLHNRASQVSAKGNLWP